MAPRFRPVLLVTLIAGSIAGTAAAQEVAKPDSAAKADTTAKPVDETIGLKLGALPLYLTGYVTSTFTYSFAATGNILVGRFYDRYQKQFMANAAELGHHQAGGHRQARRRCPHRVAVRPGCGGHPVAGALARPERRPDRGLRHR